MKKVMENWVQVLYVLCIMLIGFFVFGETPNASAAATPITIKTVDYEEENLIINNNGNTKIYYASELDAAKDKWEIIEVDEGDTTTIDISWVSSNVDSVIKVKGDKNSTQARIKLLGKTRKLEISINYSKRALLDKSDTIAPLLNIMTTAGTAAAPITFIDLEWKKGVGGKWKNSSELTVKQLEKFQVKGTDLYFRIKAINDITVGTTPPDGSKGRRACNEVKLRIAKKAPAMVVGVDGGKFTADIRYGKEYRIITLAGPSDWVKVTDRTVKSIPLASIINNGKDGTTADKAFTGIVIEIRNYATAKAAASKITQIDIEPQRTITGAVIEGKAPQDATAADKNIYVSYQGTTNTLLAIPSASTSVPYEYCVVKPGDTFDLQRATWTSVTKNTVIKIQSSKAIDGGVLYVRQKEIKSKQATKTDPAIRFALASTYVTHNINYPSVPQMDNATYTFTKGYSDSITFNIKLNTLGKKPSETEIRNIKLGLREIDFTSVVTPLIAPGADTTATAYVLSVTLQKSSLETMTNTTNRAIFITFGNGWVDKTSIKLTIQNPIPVLALTASLTQGNAAGTTAANVNGSPAAGNKYVYTITDAEVKNKVTEDTVLNGIDYTSGADITVGLNKYLTVYEVNTVTNKIVKLRSLLVSSDKIK